MISPSIFIDIDTQESFFTENESVTADEIKLVRNNLKNLTKHALKKRIKIISPVDDGVTAVKESLRNNLKKIRESVSEENSITIGAKEKLEDPKKTWKKYHQLILQTSGFDVFKNVNFLKLLKAGRIKNVIIYGYGIDFGIEKAAVYLISKGFSVWIPVDAVLAINEANREPSVKELHKLGVQIWNSEFVIANT